MTRIKASFDLMEAVAYNERMNKPVSQKIEKFFSSFKPQIYKKGEILIRADDAPGGIFYLKVGVVKEYAISKKGEELVINIFKPTAFFPMSWAINDTKNPYYFEALLDVAAYKAPRDAAVQFIKENPDVLFDLLSRVYRGTDGVMTRLTYLLSGDAYCRLLSELIIQAKRFGKKTGNAFELNISERDLAGESGLTRETVSREIKILKEKGLIVFHPHALLITDLSKLEDELLHSG